MTPDASLAGRVSAVVARWGTPRDIADEVAMHLVRAEASGHASHGILRLPQYRDEIRHGNIRPHELPKIVSDRGGSVVLDARKGFGHHSTAVATKIASERAREYGTSTVTIRNTTHIGRLGEYIERLNADGLVSLLTVGAAGHGIGAMAPFGTGAGPFLNSNPIAIGSPGHGSGFVFDASMSSVAEGKVHAARDRGVDLPAGAILDKDGRASVDPADYYAGGTLAPLGGEIAGHKGYGLALAAALLGGLAHADETLPDLSGIASVAAAKPGNPRIGGVTLLVMDPGSFGGSYYAERVGGVLDAFRDSGAVIPGDIERARRAAFDENALEPRIERVLAELEADSPTMEGTQNVRT